MKPKKRCYQEMTAKELAQATREFDEECLEAPKPMTQADRKWFDAWQKQALAHEAEQERPQTLTMVFPRELIERLAKRAKEQHTTANRLIEEAVYAIVALGE